MVLLDGDHTVGRPGPDMSRPEPPEPEPFGHPVLSSAPHGSRSARAELARLALLREEIEHFASWAERVSAGESGESGPTVAATGTVAQATASTDAHAARDNRTAELPTRQQAPVRSGVFGWSFKRR